MLRGGQHSSLKYANAAVLGHGCIAGREQVDAQSILDCMGGGNGGVPAVTKAYHEGLNRSVQAMFTVMLWMIFRGISMLPYCDLFSSMVGEVLGFYFL